MLLTLTGKYARECGGQGGRLELLADAGQRAEHQTIAGHCINNPRQREHGPKETKRWKKAIMSIQS